MKIVLDTNCLVVCLPKNSKYYCIWEAFRDKRITLCFTTDILNEYNEILPHFYDQEFVEDIINELLASFNTIKVDNYYKWNLIVQDPDDNKFVDCAFNVGASYLVTNDKHFNILKYIDFPQIKAIDINTLKELLMR
jgi:putative PIN family toxin of toxin-antitoxin system